MKAKEFAGKAHLGQERKYTGEPYIGHCQRVALMVKEDSGTQAMIDAAWLHDTVEDTATSLLEIQKEFGGEVCRIVNELTNVFTKLDYPYLNRDERNANELKRLAKISPEAKAIKRWDVQDNVSDIVKQAPRFAITYLHEEADVLKAILL